MKKHTFNEQVSRMKGMMGTVSEDSPEDEPNKKFEYYEDLVKSIRERLTSAMQNQEWSIIEEIINDITDFEMSQEEIEILKLPIPRLDYNYRPYNKKNK